MLDRDGVINKDSDAYIKTPEEWEPIEGSLEAIALLYENNFRIVVITNQSGLARGLYDRAMLNRIHDKMLRSIEAVGGKIEKIYFCPHEPDDGCHCRKPRPGLLEKFSKEKGVSLKAMPFVGDSDRDLQAADAVGAKPILVKTGNGRKTLASKPTLKIPIFENLYGAAQFILSGK